jgi:TonB family protein
MLVFSASLLALSLSLTDVPSAFGSPGGGSDQDIVSASALTATHRVSPTWPTSAPHDAEGWVLLRFTVLTNGLVTEVEVRGAQPPGVFEDSAKDALKQWKFAPVYRDGRAIVQRAEIRMHYKPEPNAAS